MGALHDAILKFRRWAASRPADERDPSWEVLYPDWQSMYATSVAFIDEFPYSQWSQEDISDILFLLARDNEAEFLATELIERSVELLSFLAEASLAEGEPDAKWQLADALGYIEPHDPRINELLLRFVHDTDEYVRRRALQSMARRSVPDTEQVALRANLPRS